MREDDEAHETAWIARVVAADDHEAFAGLVRLHQSAVRRFLRRLSGRDQDRADDLAQETFWRAYRYIRSYRGQGRFLSWVLGIAYQVFVDDYRRVSRAELVPLPEDLAAEVDEAGALAGRRTVDELLEALRPAERAVVLLHYQHGQSHTEIAAALGLPVGTVKTLIRRGRLRLQAQVRGGLA